MFSYYHSRSCKYLTRKLLHITATIMVVAPTWWLQLHSHAQSNFCAIKADSSKAVKSQTTTLELAQGKIRKIRDYLAAERWMKKKLRYEPWDQIAARYDHAVKASAFSPRQHGRPSLLGEDAYRRELVELVSKPFDFGFTEGNQVQILVDDPASFKTRKELIQAARESIYMFVWAVYDDDTGWEFADSIINAKLSRLCAGGDLDVKIIVDGNLAKQIGYVDVLHYLETFSAFSRTPIEVLHLGDNRDPFFGMHRKLMLIDREQMILGGMSETSTVIIPPEVAPTGAILMCMSEAPWSIKPSAYLSMNGISRRGGPK